MSVPVSGGHHERAIEAALAKALAGKPRCSCPDDWRAPPTDRCPEHGSGEWPARMHILRARAVLASLAEQGVRLVDLREIEELRDRLTTMSECVRIYLSMRDRGTPARPGWLEEEVSATDELLAAHFNPEAEHSEHGPD